jgi:hypothetical protein
MSTDYNQGLQDITTGYRAFDGKELVNQLQSTAVSILEWTMNCLRTPLHEQIITEKPNNLFNFLWYQSYHIAKNRLDATAFSMPTTLATGEPIFRWPNLFFTCPHRSQQTRAVRAN